MQVRYFCSHLAGNFALPPDMDAYTAAEKARRRAEEGVEEKHFHKFGGYQWGYLRDRDPCSKAGEWNSRTVVQPCTVESGYSDTL